MVLGYPMTVDTPEGLYAMTYGQIEDEKHHGTPPLKYQDVCNEQRTACCDFLMYTTKPSVRFDHQASEQLRRSNATCWEMPNQLFHPKSCPERKNSRVFRMSIFAMTIHHQTPAAQHPPPSSLACHYPGCQP